MNRSLDQYLTYVQWLLDRGQLAPKRQRCQSCGYLRQPLPSQLLVYDTLSDQEKALLTSYRSTTRFCLVKVFPCSTNAGRICVEQWQDWQPVQLVVFLGNPSATIVIGEQRFASQQGQVGKLATDARYCLTFHPRDILRYQDNAELFERDLQQLAPVNQ